MENTQFMQDLYSNAETNRDGLKDLIEKADDKEFRRTLAEQYAQYQEVMNELRSRMSSLGKTPKETNGAERFFSHHAMNVKTGRDADTEAIAKVVIDATKKSHVRLNDMMDGYEEGDDSLMALSLKLSHTQQRNIEEMERFLQ